jgi:hypothetical protein
MTPGVVKEGRIPGRKGKPEPSEFRKWLYTTPEMKVKYSSEMSVDFHRTTEHYIPANRPHHMRLCENLKSYIIFPLFTVPSVRTSQ